MGAYEKIGVEKGIRIFWAQRNGRQSQLVVHDDGTATYYVENFGWRRTRDGSGKRNRINSVGEAKLAWPSYAKAIDDAVEVLGGNLHSRTNHPSLFESPRDVARERWSLDRLSAWWSRGRRATTAM